ncbi:hypothetical protein [Micromonospora sp. WMMD736]|uniref:hypothetical protein n=1 Tax=Micromonospora sp. WMMD736 TaxID=3404112 RepID=UPI003B940306
MTSHTGRTRQDWRRGITGAFASSALAAGLLLGSGPVVHAAPGDDTDTTADGAENEAKPAMTADQALAIIAEDYDTGAGGGQLSKLIREVLVMRAQGYRPSNSNRAAIEKALDYRPNQKPLIEALQDTLMYQRKTMAQASNAGASSGGFTMGINQAPPGIPNNGNNTGVFIAPGGTQGQQPIGP